MSNLSLCRAAAVTMGAVLLLDPGASFGQTATIGTSGAMDPPAVLWKDPGPIASCDLFWAMGHAERAPQGPFRRSTATRSA